jgi:predicted N-acetyltransferase YhbS
VRETETPSLSRLADTVFGGTGENVMFRSYPHLFNRRNLENLFVFVDGDRVVSHVGMTMRWACLAGCTVRVASVGAVCTYEECRGRGMASQLFRTACDKAVADGVDFMLISGGRSLYRRAGATEVGCDFLGAVERRTARRVSRRGIEMAEFRETDLSDCAATYEARQAHFIRPIEDWRWFLEVRRYMAKDARWMVVRDRGVFRGYFVLVNTREAGVGEIVEFAGDDLGLAGALKALMDHGACHTVKIRVQQGDRILKDRLEGAGAVLQPGVTGWTLLVLSFPQLMQRLGPYFEARVGIEQAKDLAFAEENGQCIFSAKDDRLAVDRAAAARLIFGHPEAKPLPGLFGRILPAPTLWCGLNYV